MLPHTQTRLTRSTRQDGAALLVLLVIVVIAATGVLLNSLNRASVATERDKKTAEVLAQAKEALIAYAATYGDINAGKVHGYLPCPDRGTATEGAADSSCGSKDVSVLGRLPWKTLGLEAKSSQGECLWYAISGAYKNNPDTDLLNWDTNGQFEVLASNGQGYLAGPSTTASESLAVAVIFAPGAPVSGQNRDAATGTASCGGNYTASNYLDNDTVNSINNGVISSVAKAISRFIDGPVNDTNGSAIVNDKLLTITRDEIFNAIAKRNDFTAKINMVTQKVAECIANYGFRNSLGLSDKRLPWAGSFLSAADYWTNSNYVDDSGLMSGRVPYRVNTSDSVTLNAITSPHYQLFSTSSGCPSVLNWPGENYEWWQNWKDHFFYMLAYDFRPAAGSSPSCGTCLSVNGSGSYAAIVIFAGRKLAGQTRITSTDRANFANYLEGRNLTNDPNTAGNGNYQKGSATASFNDVLYCIDTNLAVSPCP